MTVRGPLSHTILTLEIEAVITLMPYIGIKGQKAYYLIFNTTDGFCIFLICFKKYSASVAAFCLRTYIRYSNAMTSSYAACQLNTTTSCRLPPGKIPCHCATYLGSMCVLGSVYLDKQLFAVWNGPVWPSYHSTKHEGRVLTGISRAIYHFPQNFDSSSQPTWLVVEYTFTSHM